ncbi:MAG: hypothetical protein JWQ55_6138 [Rhodopila sp.]|nr:hypothetical protein [Rhodopila sp.]
MIVGKLIIGLDALRNRRKRCCSDSFPQRTIAKLLMPDHERAGEGQRRDLFNHRRAYRDSNRFNRQFSVARAMRGLCRSDADEKFDTGLILLSSVKTKTQNL